MSFYKMVPGYLMCTVAETEDLNAVANDKEIEKKVIFMCENGYSDCLRSKSRIAKASKSSKSESYKKSPAIKGKMGSS